MNQQQAIQSLDQPIIDVVAPMRDAVNVPVVAGCCFPQGWGYADQPIAVQTWLHIMIFEYYNIITMELE